MRYIELTQGKKAIVDDRDFKRVAKYKWCFADGYAKRTALVDGIKKVLRMHHLIIPFKPPLMIDHINGEGTDNRRSNLRMVTKSQNMMNSGPRVNSRSGFKGVTWDKKSNKWRVNIWKDYRQYDLGRFEDKSEAILAYNQAAKIYHGEYARLNVIL